MSLDKYQQKRHFNDTPEPEGKVEKKKQQHIFVVQRHKASHLHYDFRLEMEGVLKSWAVPKGPSMNPKDKRLAMMVEDHPVSYATFEGSIPEGNYGAGIVEVWDSGKYELTPDNKGTNVEAIDKGSLKFILKGKKLKGKFALIKLKNAAPNSWLLLKDKDEYAVTESYNSEEHTDKQSAINKALAKEKTTGSKSSSNKKTEPEKETVSKKKRPLKTLSSQ